MPLVSIIVPIYNTSRYLEKCLLSIAEQSLHDFEAICVDDNSTDGSGDIVKRFARSDPRFKLVTHNENRHAGGARNSGIRMARSNYVYFADSDDYLDADLLARAHDSTESERYDIVVFGFRVVDPTGRLIRQHHPEARDLPAAHEIKGRLLITEPAPWNKLIRRTLFTEDGLWFPEKTYWEDLATVPRLLVKARSLRFISAPLYSYVDREGSHVNQQSDRHVMDYLRVFDILKDFLIAEGLYESEQKDFDQLLKTNFRWYANKLLTSRHPDRKLVDQWVKYCALVAGAYLSADDQLRGKTAVENLGVIETFSRPQAGLPAPAPVAAGVPEEAPGKPGWIAGLRRILGS